VYRERNFRTSLLAVGAGHQREGEAEALDLVALNAADQIGAGDDIAPLVIPADLELTAPGLVELEEIVALQELIVELDKREALLEAQLVRLEGEHAVDREVTANIPEKLDIVEVGEPLGVVHHGELDVPGGEKALDLPTDGRRVGVDLLHRKHPAHLRLARGVTDPGGAATDDDDAPMTELGEMRQGVDRNEVADVQGVPRRVDTDVEGKRSRVHPFPEALLVGALSEETPLFQPREGAGAMGKRLGRIRRLRRPLTSLSCRSCRGHQLPALR